MPTAVQQFELVPTPPQFVGEVYALLARLMGTSPPASPKETDNTEADDHHVTTDETLIRRIYQESHEAHRRLLKRLATSPGQWVYASELAADLELSGGNKSLAGMLGALGRRSNHRYQGKRAFHSEWDHIKGETKHMMPSAAATVIEKL